MMQEWADYLDTLRNDLDDTTGDSGNTRTRWLIFLQIMGYTTFACGRIQAALLNGSHGFIRA
jgi:hypothetical protein